MNYNENIDSLIVRATYAFGKTLEIIMRRAPVLSETEMMGARQEIGCMNAYLDAAISHAGEAMPTHQQRVADEKAELDGNIGRLAEFIESSPIFAGLPDDEKERMIRQKSCMGEYSEILGERISAFTEAF